MLFHRLATKLKQITEDYEARESVSLFVSCHSSFNPIGRLLSIAI